MSDCDDCHPAAKNAAERRVLLLALLLNAAMALLGSVVGWAAGSTGLLADALDMLSDAAAYAIALLAVNRGPVFKARAATLSGGVLLVLGAAILVEVARRTRFGVEPVGGAMMAMSVLSLAVNLSVLRLLRPLRSGDVHLRASWLFTRADVVANVGVLLSGAIVLSTGSRVPDLVIGAAIGIWVVKESVEILAEARRARRVRIDTGESSRAG